MGFEILHQPPPQIERTRERRRVRNARNLRARGTQGVAQTSRLRFFRRRQLLEGLGAVLRAAPAPRDEPSGARAVCTRRSTASVPRPHACRAATSPPGHESRKHVQDTHKPAPP